MSTCEENGLGDDRSVGCSRRVSLSVRDVERDCSATLQRMAHVWTAVVAAVRTGAALGQGRSWMGTAAAAAHEQAIVTIVHRRTRRVTAPAMLLLPPR